jgi:hypothetical protein
MAGQAAGWYRAAMNLLIVTLVLLLLLGGGGLYVAGLGIGGEGIGVVLVIGAIVYWAGGCRAKQ